MVTVSLVLHIETISSQENRTGSIEHRKGTSKQKEKTFSCPCFRKNSCLGLTVLVRGTYTCSVSCISSSSCDMARNKTGKFFFFFETGSRKKAEGREQRKRTSEQANKRMSERTSERTSEQTGRADVFSAFVRRYPQEEREVGAGVLDPRTCWPVPNSARRECVKRVREMQKKGFSGESVVPQANNFRFVFFLPVHIGRRQRRRRDPVACTRRFRGDKTR